MKRAITSGSREDAARARAEAKVLRAALAKAREEARLSFERGFVEGREFERARTQQPYFDWLDDPTIVAIGALLPAERDRASLHCTCRRLAGLRGAIIRQLGLPTRGVRVLSCDFVPRLLISFGELLAAAGDQKIQLFNVEGECVRSIKVPSWVLIITQFGDQLAVGCTNHKLYLYSLDGAHTTTLSEHSNCVRALCTLGELLASGCLDDNSIKLWNKSGSCILTLTGHACSLVTWGELLASGCLDGTIKLWDASGTCVRTIIGHEGTVDRLVVFKDFLISSDRLDTILRWWDKSGTCAQVLHGHSSWIRGLASSSTLLASACKYYTKIWNVDGECLRTVERDASDGFIFQRPLLFLQERLLEIVHIKRESVNAGIVVMWE
jgi:hypothetical protein